jgi:hypothetical protein
MRVIAIDIVDWTQAFLESRNIRVRLVASQHVAVELVACLPACSPACLFGGH